MIALSKHIVNVATVCAHNSLASRISMRRELFKHTLPPLTNLLIKREFMRVFESWRVHDPTMLRAVTALQMLHSWQKLQCDGHAQLLHEWNPTKENEDNHKCFPVQRGSPVKGSSLASKLSDSRTVRNGGRPMDPSCHNRQSKCSTVLQMS